MGPRLKRTIKRLFFPLAILFIATSFTGAYFSDSITVSGNNFSTGEEAEDPPLATPADIVINEFLPNPVGPEPTGEWIELYNKGGSSADINGWYVYDAIDSHALPISVANVAGGSTVISAGGFLLVNYQAPSTFSMNNSGSESIRLYDALISSGALIDSFAYNGTIEGISWGRVPDGIGSITNNHVPTPGMINI